MLTFFIGALSGFCLALPVGAIALMCINKTLQFGIRSGLAVGLGAALADADRKSTRLNSSHMSESRMPSSA